MGNSQFLAYQATKEKFIKNENVPNGAFFVSTDTNESFVKLDGTEVKLRDIIILENENEKENLASSRYYQ